MELNFNQHSQLSSSLPPTLSGASAQAQAYQQQAHQALKPHQNSPISYQHNNHGLHNHHHQQHHASINNSAASVSQHNVAQHVAASMPSGVPHQQLYYYPSHLPSAVHQPTPPVSHHNHQRQSPVNQMCIPKSSSQVGHHAGSSSKSASHRGVGSSSHQLPGGHTVPGPGPGGVVPPPIQVPVPVGVSSATGSGQQSSGGATGGGRSFAAALRNLAKQAGPSGQDVGPAQEESRGRESGGSGGGAGSGSASARQTAASPKQQLSHRHGGQSKRDSDKQEKESRSSSSQHPAACGNQPVSSGQIGQVVEARSGFQPYRPEEPREPRVVAPPAPAPAFASPLDCPCHHPAVSHHHAAALYPPPHLQHAYRVEEQLYLERCGALSLFPLTYPPALYGLMPSLPLMSPSMHDRLKMEDEHRARERAQEEREREREKERREKNKRSPRASPSHHSSSEHGRKSSSSATNSSSHSTSSGAGPPQPPPPPQFVGPFEDSFSNKSQSTHHQASMSRHGTAPTPPTTTNPSVSPSTKSQSSAQQHQNHAGRSSPYGHYTTRHTTTQSLAPGAPVPPAITTAPMVIPYHHQMAPPHLVNAGISELSPLLGPGYQTKALRQTSPPETVMTTASSPLLSLTTQTASSSPSGLRHTPPNLAISQPPMHLYAPNNLDQHGGALSHLSSSAYPGPAPPAQLLNHYPPTAPLAMEIGTPTYVPMAPVSSAQVITPTSPAQNSFSHQKNSINTKHASKSSSNASIQDSTHLTSAAQGHEAIQSALPLSKKSVISSAQAKSGSLPTATCTNVTTASVTVTTTTVTTVNNHSAINNCRPLDVANLVVQPLGATMSSTAGICCPVTSSVITPTLTQPNPIPCPDQSNAVPCHTNPLAVMADVKCEPIDVKCESMQVCYPTHQAGSLGLNYGQLSQPGDSQPLVEGVPPQVRQLSLSSLECTSSLGLGLNGAEHTQKKYPFPLWDCKGMSQQKTLSKLDMIAERRRYLSASNGDQEIYDFDWENETEFYGGVVLTKGPPDKLDAPPKKIHFLAMFGLTTLARRNELELRKLSRRRAVPPVELAEDSDFAEQDDLSPLSLPKPNGSPRALMHSSDKLTYMTALGLVSLNRQQRQEREKMWQEVLAERRRRQCVTPLVLYCQEAVTGAGADSPPAQQPRWPGADDVIHSYLNYHRETTLELCVLREENSRLRQSSSEIRDEARGLEHRLDELHSTRDALLRQRDALQNSIDMLTGVLKDIAVLTNR